MIDIGPFTRGFLPEQDPLAALSPPFAAWETTGRDLSKLALTSAIRPEIQRLPPFPTDQLHTDRELERAMTLLSYMGSMYVFAPDHPVATRLPANLARGWYAVGRRLQRPPILTYASQGLFNWRRIDPQGPVAVGNIVLIQNFLGGMDEEWFVTIHTHIEAIAGPMIKALRPAQQAATLNDTTTVRQTLETITTTLDEMQAVFNRMPERCDPDIYYHRVRPYMFGWKDNPLLPDGMIYDGVEAYQGRPVQFRGETGAQSSIIPALDAFLGISHEYDEMRAYLNEMRQYMPLPHQQFLTLLESAPSIRDLISENDTARIALREAYNNAVAALTRFRRLHIEFAAAYILKPARQEAAVGTGGTPFTVYLKKHIRETEAHILPANTDS